MTLNCQSHDRIADVDAAGWNAIAGDVPFLRHEFLNILEVTGCVAEATGWQPKHLTLTDAEQRIVAAMPLYFKHDSWGEFVFDFSWADAYRRAGLNYYPKIVCAVPFTPATGPRMLFHPDYDRATLAASLLAGVKGLAEEFGASSFHTLFPDPDQTTLLKEMGLHLRKACQFHWHNDGYGDFDQFLGEFSSAKRKKARRERRRIQEAGIHFETVDAGSISDEDWEAVYEFHARTFYRRGRAPYLTQTAFDTLREQMPQSMVIVLGRHAQTPIGAAICFRSAETLYGRYWGSLDDYHSMHFETCYYQGVEYCIREGLQRFEPGTQGEHKISRGFVPVETYSAHWLADTQFDRAVGDFVRREGAHTDAYIREMTSHSPYRQQPPTEA
jgi:predicted N-acyltransferase